MKKIVALLMILTLALSLMVGCGDKEKDYTLAIGVSASAEDTEVSNTVAAIVTDADGKIVLCRIDAIAVAPTVTEGAVDATKTYKSKAELGDNYNMVKYGKAKAEWYVQAKAVEEFVVGKTRDEVKSIAVGADGKPTDADLLASCTISVDDFKKAIDKAFESAHKVSFKSASALTAGVAVTGDVSSEAAEVSYTADFAATVFADGKIVAAIIDSNEFTATLNGDKVEGITLDKTKLEKGDDYNMVKYGKAKAEWYVQAQTYANTAVGKTATDVKALATENVAGCTIYVGGYKATLEKAADYTR